MEPMIDETIYKLIEAGIVWTWYDPVKRDMVIVLTDHPPRINPNDPTRN
jgi:hypothetical protein